MSRLATQAGIRRSRRGDTALSSALELGIGAGWLGSEQSLCTASYGEDHV
jgi:hypothetical protein